MLLFPEVDTPASSDHITAERITKLKSCILTEQRSVKILLVIQETVMVLGALQPLLAWPRRKQNCSCGGLGCVPLYAAASTAVPDIISFIRTSSSLWFLLHRFCPLVLPHWFQSLRFHLRPQTLGFLLTPESAGIVASPWSGEVCFFLVLDSQPWKLCM